MNYYIRHHTLYRYAEPVSFCHNLAHLRPLSDSRQSCRKFRLLIQPDPRSLRHFEDYFGNHATYFSIEQPHTELEVTVESEVEMDVYGDQLDFTANLSWEAAGEQVQRSRNQAMILAREYCYPSKLVGILPELRRYAEPSFTKGRPFSEAAQDLTHRIYSEFDFDPNVTDVSTPIEDVLRHRHGVCQDFAHLAIGCVRAMGLPAAYISGYLETAPPPGKPKLLGADASHAWFAVYQPELGWMQYDPTNDRIPNNQYIRVARGRDFDDVSPLKGVIFGGGEEHHVEVSVDVLNTKPTDLPRPAQAAATDHTKERKPA